MNRNYLLCLLFLLFFQSVFSTVNNDYQDILVTFSNASLTVKQALEELDRLTEISVVYNGNEDFLNIKLNFTQRTMTVQDALETLRTQAPVDIIFNNNHIIVKARTLSKEYMLSGMVVDARTHEGLIAADIYLEGTSRGTVTDPEGNFSISLPPGTYLVNCRYVGYEEKEMEINLFDNRNLMIQLEVMQHPIDEVSISGTREEMESLEKGRPIEKIDGRTVNRLNTNDVNDALQGRINGVWATKVSGAPGDHYRIRIRGMNSIFGSTDPLYVVDGVMVPVVNFKSLGVGGLNSHDVEEIIVLKDAASTALYGYMGGNGVVIINTRKGGGEPRFRLNVKQGFQTMNKRYPLQGTHLFLHSLRQSDRLFRTEFYLTDRERGIYPKYPVFYDSLGKGLDSTDFQDELFRHGAVSEVQLSAAGSIKSLDYYFSGNYYTHQGIVTNTLYDKYSFSGSLGRQIGEKLTIRLGYRGSVQENLNNLDNYLGNNVIYKGINYEPGYYFTPDSFLQKSERMFVNHNYFMPKGSSIEELGKHTYTPEMLMYEQRKEKKTISHVVSMEGAYRLNPHISMHAFYSLTMHNMAYEAIIPGTSDYDPPRYMSSDEEISIISQQYDLRYQKSVGDNRFTGFIRYRNYRDNIYWLVDSLQNVDLEGLSPENNIYVRGSSSIFGSTGSIIRRTNALVGNINYIYRDKYSVSVFANLDDLQEGKYVRRQALFPSVALDWNLTREERLQFPQWVHEMHLYASWGRAGNYPLNSLSNDIYITQPDFVVNDTAANATYISSLANHHLKHEVVTEYNFGSSLSLFDERVILSADYFMKYNSDLLIQRHIPGYYGGGFYYQNIGEMQNKGIEINLELTPVERPHFVWTNRFGYATNNQVITRLYDSVPISFNNSDLLYPDFYARVNEPLGAITGFLFAGAWDDSIHSDAVNGYQKFLKAGGGAYYKFDTLNRRNLTDGDKVVIGNSIPDFYLNWISLVRYKRFSCEMHWYGVFGVDKYNATRATTYVTGTNLEVREMVLDTLGMMRNDVFYQSSYFVEDASFIRLKSLTFRYEHPPRKPGGIGFEYALSFENLLTLTRYSGYDPEATIYTDNNFTDNAMDKGSYPNPLGVFLSVQLSF